MASAAHRTLDCRDTLCPGPVVEVSRAMRILGVNEVLEVLATDPGFVPDIQAFSKRTGHALLAVESLDGGFRALIRRVQ
ncbi:MAG: sulfurtransferase TusA family protein [Candidatus Rokubacteria bacterium]|nr:sulfurtransferase TusA family protein [Candidatus Rokubacteria bacterium]